MAMNWYRSGIEEIGELSTREVNPIQSSESVIGYHDRSLLANLWAKDFGDGKELDLGLILMSESLKNKLFAREVYAIVPLYVTSICSEKCLYCNFRTGNKDSEIDRVRLSDSDLAKETDFLIKVKGLRTIELVYATDPLVRVDSMCRHVELVKNMLDQYGGGIVGINAEALDESEYRSLVDAGLTFVVLWQETYDQVRYLQLHPGTTKKTRFEYRLEAVDRMVYAGVENFGMGLLSGLSDWRKDWAMLMLHEEYLFQSYARFPSILGIPRLKPATGAVIKTTDFVPSRQELIACVALHNLYSPWTLPFVNTREDWELCVDLSRGGGTLFTFNCSTIPGGYTLGSHGNQFPTNSFDIIENSKRISQASLNVIVDWTFPNEVSHPALMAS